MDRNDRCDKLIRTYYMRLDGDCSKEQSLALYDTLPKERKESIAGVRDENVAKKRLYVGAFLQYVLSKETGIPVEQLRYAYNEWGKPELDMESMPDNVRSDVVEKDTITNLCFNLSHSGDYVVLAVANSPVGIDIEHKSKNYLSLAKRFFCKEEYEDIFAQMGEREQKRRFLEYWTMKEAYIKYVGEGLRISLNSFRIDIGTDGMSSVTEHNVYFKTFFMDEEYCVSICSDSPMCCEEKNWCKIEDIV